ncbi:MAG: hypothetical protein AAFN79_06965 [Pseudomonadota bacterium]
MKHVIFAAGLALAALVAPQASADPTFVPPKAKEGHSYPDCYCTNRGVKVPVGQMSCLTVGSRTFTARCGMSLNNTAWREVKDGCDPINMSEASPDSDFLQPG